MLTRTLRIFLASPSDVKEERIRVESVVSELNRTVAGELKFTIELVKWETHARPGIGADAQDVINRQMPVTDIFVGVMWTRLGTETSRARSGTVEEFERFWERDSRAQKNIMFYFCQRPFFTAKSGDLDQFKKVLAFRLELQLSGLLTWTYVSPQDFENCLREHLVDKILELGKADGSLDQYKKVHLPTNSFRNSEIEIAAKKAINEGMAALVFIDVDSSKRLNDQFGTTAMDLALGSVKDTVSKTLGRKGEVFRYFGDEFVVIFPNTAIEEAAATAERVRREVQAQQYTKALISLTISCGVGAAQNSQEPQTLIETLRRACFVSKIRGKNRVTALPLSSQDDSLLEAVYSGQRRPS